MLLPAVLEPRHHDDDSEAVKMPKTFPLQLSGVRMASKSDSNNSPETHALIEGLCFVLVELGEYCHR